MLNNSASPVIVLIPMATTFIGYTTGVISKGMDAADLEGSSFTVFIQSLPFQFFSYVSVFIALLSLVSALNFLRMRELMEHSGGGQKESKKKI